MFGRKKDRNLTEAEKAERDERQSKFEKTRDKFKLGPHHKMERFGVISFVFFFCVLFVLGGSFYTFREQSQVNLDGSAIYTESFSSSLSQTSGTVAGIYGNKDKTKVYVLLKFTDSSGVTLNADNYKVFISAYQDRLRREPKGVFQVLGSSGYVGVELISNGGFDSQVMDMWIRIGENIKKAKYEESELHKLDSTFRDYDQIRVLLNPGAKSVEYAPVLDDNSATIADIYKALVASDTEKSLKQTMQTTINDMQVQYNTIDEYRRRLQSLNVRVPKMPKMIEGDSFEALKNENGQMITDYDYKAGSIYPNGLMLDWRNLTVADGGYFKSIDPSITDKEGYYTQLTSGTTTTDDTATTDTAEEWQWAYTDGKAIAENSGFDRDKTALDAISTYEGAVNKYQNLKREYQTNQMYQLLLLEINSDNINLDAQVNADNENAIVVWQQVR